MTKKRTKRQKQLATSRRVNSQLAYKFPDTYNFEPKNTSAVDTAKSEYLASVKKELFKSLIIAILILTSLMVLYWFS